MGNSAFSRCLAARQTETSLYLRFALWQGRSSEILNNEAWNTHNVLSSSFLGLLSRILNTNHKKELLRSPRVMLSVQRSRSALPFRASL